MKQGTLPVIEVGDKYLQKGKNIEVYLMEEGKDTNVISGHDSIKSWMEQQVSIPDNPTDIEVVKVRA